MSEQTGIKELNELLDAVEVLAVAGKEILKDGKVNLEDLPILMSLITKANLLVEGFKGLNALGEEVKDIHEDEAVIIVKKLYAIAAKVK